MFLKKKQKNNKKHNTLPVITGEFQQNQAASYYMIPKVRPGPLA